MLVSSLSSGSAGGAGLEHGLSVLIELQLGDDTVGWVDTNLDGATVYFLALHSFDVDDEFSSVNIDNLAGLLAFEVTTDNHDLDNFIIHCHTNVIVTYFIILSDRKRSDIVLSSQFLGEWSRHDL